MVFSTSRFQSLSIRPPTPPKDLEESARDSDELLDFLDDPFGTNPQPLPTAVAVKSLLNTPEQSPSSDGPSSSASRKKKVNFHVQTCTIPQKSLTPQTFAPLHSSPLRPLPQTRVSKPLKSILKASDATSTPPPADEGAAAHKFKSFADMLESIVKLLAQDSRSSRFDAYHSLHRTMQAYDKIPDIQALVAKMGLLTQFIRRDIQAVSMNGRGLDSQLIAQALKLLMALVRIPELRPAMDDDFCSFIVDRVIQVAADASMPKTIVNAHLALLMQQNFRTTKTITPARVERILDVLDTIQERVSGYSVLAYRVRVYRKLIQQQPEPMKKHTERWFKHAVQALLSTVKDINQSALDMTMSAVKTIGTDRLVIRSVLSVLNRQKSDGERIAKVFAKELERMLDTEHASMVPQIWSAVTALLHGSLNVELFPSMAEWLTVFEKCLHSRNDLVKVHANVAVGFLLYTVKISEDTPSSWIKMLISIPQHQLQLQRRGQWKKEERVAPTSGYFTLLYYSLRPSASSKQLERYWTECVADFWNPLVHSSPSNAFAACRVVSALLDNPSRIWNEQRALDLRPQAMIQREELPLLDSKWVRKCLSSILKFVETLLDATPWVVDECKDEPAKTMWLSLLTSLNEASSKEVTASTETKDAMAHIVNMLRRVWDRHTAQLALSQQKEDSWADKFCFLLETVVQQLGALQFADKCLVRNGADFEVAPTPSHRSRQYGSRLSPLLYFTDLLVNQSEGKLSDSVRVRALELMLEPCLTSQNTRLSRLELLRDCSAVVDRSSTVAFNFWVQIATLTKSCIQEQPADPSDRASRQLGREYEIMVDILSSGSVYLLNQSRGQEVLVRFTDTVRREAGEGAVVLAVIERVSECVLKRTAEEDKTACLPFMSILLRNLPKTIARRTIEQGRQNLWPSSPNPARNQEFDPYNHLYAAVVSIGSAAYGELLVEHVDVASDFLAALGSSIRQCPVALLAVYLRRLQDTIRLWVEDPDKKMQKKDRRIKDFHQQVVKLWQEVCAAIERLPRKDSLILLHLEPLIKAGFLSRRRGIVNVSIAMWNKTFGREETLRYPAQLEQALRRLRNTVELSLPSLEAQEEDADNELSFYDSDNSGAGSERNLKSPRVKESPFKIVKSARNSRSPAVTSTSSRRIGSRHTPNVRLRHDNSQIHFEPIVSSPANPFNQESQLLTERQREMLERQKTSNLFANMGTSSPSRQEAHISMPSPLELHSDALSADDLPVENSRTPLRSLPAVAPMDVFLGSSPTPQARNRTQQQVVSDEASVTTPTAVCTVRLADDAEELGSSPPRFEKDIETNVTVPTRDDKSDDMVGDSFDHRQLEPSYSVSFEEGTTVDDEMLPEASPLELLDNKVLDTDGAQDDEAADMLSETLELQLTAQFDADMKTQMDAVTTVPIEDPPQESENVFVDAASHPLPAEAADPNAGSDTEVDETQAEPPITIIDSETHDESGDTSLVGDSFLSQAEADTPRIEKLRRSARHSTSSSPSQPDKTRKRRKSASRGPGRPKKSKVEEVKKEAVQQPLKQVSDDDGMLNLDVASPKSTHVPVKKTRKSLQGPPDSQVVIPETTRKLGVRRSASLLSQVETVSADVVVEDTPTPKRARRSKSQDVSQAKTTPTEQASQVKRLSHVQVTPKSSPKSSSNRGSSAAVEDKETDAPLQAATGPGLAQDAPTMGEQNTNVAQHLPDDTFGPGPRETEQNQTQSQSQSQQATSGPVTPSRSFAERVILTPRSIINQLKNLKEALFRSSQLVMGRQEEREIDDVLFDIRRSVHDAGRRSEGRQ